MIMLHFGELVANCMNFMNLLFSYDMLVPPMTVMFLNRAFYMKSTPMFSLENGLLFTLLHFISYHCEFFFS